MTAVPNILVVDDSALCRELITRLLTASGMKVTCAADGLDALATLGRQSCDAVVLDNEMPNMNGIGLLRALRADARWQALPVLMLTTTVAREVILEAAKYGLAGYVLKAKLSLPDIVVRLRQALSVTPAGPAVKPPPPVPDKMGIPNYVPRDAALEAMTKFAELGTLPGTPRAVIELIDSGKAAAGDVVTLVRQDPILCTALLRRATSPEHGGGKARIGGVEDVIRVLDLATVRAVAAGTPVVRRFPADRADGLGLLRCWQHTLAVAAVMRWIVPRSDLIPGGLPYLIGLCHDLTELLLRQRFPNEFDAAADYAAQAELPTTELAKHVFGVPYAKLTQTLLTHLALPPAVGGPVRDFTAAARETVDAHANALTRSLAIANYLANGLLCASSPNDTVAPVLLNDCTTALIPTKALNLPELRAEAVTATRVLCEAPPDQLAALNKPVIARSGAKLWYYRHPAFAPLDPIEAALTSLANADCHDRLPQQDELLGMHGLVAVLPRGVTLPGETARLLTPGGRPLPVLHLHRAGETPQPPPGGVALPYPVTLARLSEFVAGLNSER